MHEYISPRIQKKPSSILSKASLILGVGLLILILFLFIGYQRTGSKIVPIVGSYTVAPGSGLYTVIDDIGSNSALSKLWIKNQHEAMDIQAGTYIIPDDTTISELFTDILTQTPLRGEVQVTLLPGWNIADMSIYLDDILQAGGDIVINESRLLEKFRSQYDFLAGVDSIEGFLYPDTYRIFVDATIDDVVAKMLDTFESRIWDEFGDEKQLDFYELLTLASIVEKEEKNSANKPIVAGVLKKRYLENWFIGADATLCYQEKLVQSECQDFVNSYYSSSLSTRQSLGYEYDTRLYLGLPPTPISSVSADTFFATYDSEASPYYYYLHDSTGQIHYGIDEGEHNANKRQYLY